MWTETLPQLWVADGYDACLEGLAKDIKDRIQETGRAMVRAVGPASTNQALKAGTLAAFARFTWRGIEFCLQ